MSRSPVSASEAAAAPRLGSAARRNCVWYVCQMLLKVVFTVWLRYRVRGVARIPRVGSGVILSNHQSFLDPLLIGIPLRRPVSFLARDSLFRVPVIGWLLRNTYVMPINREAASTASLRETLRRIDQGFLVGVFPEGTRSTDGAVGPFKPGFAAIVRRAKSPVFPVGIAGAHRALGRNSLFLKPYRVCVVFGEPFTAEEMECLSVKGHEVELVETVRRRIIECQREAEEWLSSKPAAE